MEEQTKAPPQRPKSLQSLLQSLPIEDQRTATEGAPTFGSIEKKNTNEELLPEQYEDFEEELPGTSVVLYADVMGVPSSPHEIESLAVPHEDSTSRIESAQNILPLLNQAAADSAEVPQLIDADQLRQKLEGRTHAFNSELRTLHAHEQQTNRDRRALNAKTAEADQLRLSNEALRSEVERLSIAKEQLEMKLLDFSSLQSELQSTKIDSNRIRMEVNRLKVDYDAALNEISSLREDAARKSRDADMMSITYEQRLKEMEIDRRRTFDQVRYSLVPCRSTICCMVVLSMLLLSCYTMICRV
jgi:DNA repair exonuclease SbcCD ATPase subunit